MIAQLVGRVRDVSTGRIVVGLEVGPSSILGLEVLVPRTASYAGLAMGSTVQLLIHSAFREDGVELMGFLTIQEKDLFQTLLRVSGIGPKGALSILSAAEPAALVRAVTEGDREFLVALPGVGKKTADRILLELSDRMRMPAPSGAVFAGSGDAGPSSRVWSEARSALSGLGYRDAEIEEMLSRVPKTADLDRAEVVVLAALKGAEL